jgi:hypothetical protein
MVKVFLFTYSLDIYRAEQTGKCRDGSPANKRGPITEVTGR